MTLDSLPTSPLQRAAIDYASNGWVVFPVRDKRPLVRGWREFEPGQAHVKQAAVWWHAWSRRTCSADIALRTGRYGDAWLVVIDVDTRNGGRVDPEWSATLTASTPSGGVHLFYTSGTFVPNSAGEVAPGVDVRGEGGFVVVPPSPGREWINGAVIEPLPALPGRTSGTGRRDRETGLPEQWRPFEPADAVSEGGRNGYIAKAAGWLLSQGIPEGEVETMLQEHNVVVCDPPLPDDEVAAVVESIGRYHR